MWEKQQRDIRRTSHGQWRGGEGEGGDNKYAEALFAFYRTHRDLERRFIGKSWYAKLATLIADGAGRWGVDTDKKTKSIK